MHPIRSYYKHTITVIDNWAIFSSSHSIYYAQPGWYAITVIHTNHITCLGQLNQWWVGGNMTQHRTIQVTNMVPQESLTGTLHVLIEHMQKKKKKSLP